ncbi:MAG TPA: hypothetical protein VND68_12105 [Chloroflexia bacterium]|nr:hypothetical protein [Chloroflexia bacterium]
MIGRPPRWLWTCLTAGGQVYLVPPGVEQRYVMLHVKEALHD